MHPQGLPDPLAALPRTLVMSVLNVTPVAPDLEGQQRLLEKVKELSD